MCVIEKIVCSSGFVSTESFRGVRGGQSVSTLDPSDRRLRNESRRDETTDHNRGPMSSLIVSQNGLYQKVGRRGLSGSSNCFPSKNTGHSVDD